MRKILLVIENYNDLVQLESMLKKLGFDTSAVHNAYAMAESLIAFSPDVVVMTGKGNKVNGVEWSQKIKKRKGIPKIILMFPKNHQPTNQDLRANMDLVAETPLEPLRFLQQLCNLLGLDPNAFLDKIAKLQLSESSDPESTAARHAATATPESDVIRIADRTERSNKYDVILQENQLPDDTGLDRQKVQSAIKLQRKNGVQKDVELDEARQSFVRALFSKK